MKDSRNWINRSLSKYKINCLLVAPPTCYPLFQVGYTIAGSFIFMTIEGKHILQMKYELIGNRSLYAYKLWNITMDLNNKVQINCVVKKISDWTFFFPGDEQGNIPK